MIETHLLHNLALTPSNRRGSEPTNNLGVRGITVDVDFDDNIYVAGSSYASTVIFGSQQVANTGPPGTGDALVCSFTTDGGYRWAKVRLGGWMPFARTGHTSS